MPFISLIYTWGEWFWAEWEYRHDKKLLTTISEEQLII